MPQERTIQWQQKSDFTIKIIDYWAGRNLPNWQETGKVTASRVLAAKLAAGKDIEEANAYIVEQKPWGKTGSSWALHPNGDYDFTLTILTGILYMFGDKPEVLYPQTREHLLDTLLTEEGTSKRLHTPMTLGLIRETENHILMTQGSCYLKNRWLRLHGNTDAKYNNVKNGMENLMLDYLSKIENGGPYEFNSIPYLAYTMAALLNLEAYGSEKVSGSARLIIDRMNWNYAVGSLSMRRYVPFRRQIRKASNTSLKYDYQHSFIKVWMSFKPEAKLDSAGFKSSHALWPGLMPYRLSDKTAEWIESKPEDYFVRIGHGPQASPEIYSGGPGYLLTAGGVNRGKLSMIAARPTTLILNDKADELGQVLHLAGPGNKPAKWNNTGVYRDFACAAGQVYIPANWQPAAKNELWSIYSKGNMQIAVHSCNDIGIVALFHQITAGKVLELVTKANSQSETLYKEFHWPNGEIITYDLRSSEEFVGNPIGRRQKFRP